TTIRIHGKAMGREAIRLLFSRIKEPGLEFRTVYSGTTLLYRGSTGD
ncbi:MAG: substrate-binding domain-containing protein, partial [Treponema sp.]|nr:substrate-binding domain-containing protein [Treponema sp.]